MLDLLLANHCAPALLGIKPSSIATYQKSKDDDIHAEVEKLNSSLNKNDIYIEILCECESRAVMIVYRKRVLEKHLNERLNKAFLNCYGYAQSYEVDEYLSFLKTRLNCENFPHEIGVFLGYPLKDVYSFINHRDEGCIMTGEWKVYHNPEEAEKTFCRFRKCKKALSEKVENGKTLAQIFCAA